MTRAYVALGSNLEHPAKQIRAAFSALATLPATQLVRTSSLYQTTPVGFSDQPDFINAAAELDTGLAPLTLLHHLLDLEADFGRMRSFRNAPRVLDLDLLWYQGVSMADPQLMLPHPRMHQRAFVLIPLREIAADLELSALGTIAELAECLDAAGVARVTD